MRHLFLIILLVVIVYAAWQFMPKTTRRTAAREVTRHGIRLGALVAIVLALAAAAYYLPVSQFLS